MSTKRLKGEIKPITINHQFNECKVEEKNHVLDTLYRVTVCIEDDDFNMFINGEKEFSNYKDAKTFYELFIKKYPASEVVITEVNEVEKLTYEYS